MLDLIDLFLKVLELIDKTKDAIMNFRKLDKVQKIKGITLVTIVTIGCILMFTFLKKTLN